MGYWMQCPIVLTVRRWQLTAAVLLFDVRYTIYVQMYNLAHSIVGGTERLSSRDSL